jgi:lipopolysaccharide assembly outer membrane protein LptD (OstA)
MIFDIDEGDIAEVGSWLDYRTDCLGFRFMLSYETEYERVDFSEEKSDFRFGFFIYLRALGPDAANPFKSSY